MECRGMLPFSGRKLAFRSRECFMAHQQTRMFFRAGKPPHSEALHANGSWSSEA